MQVLTYVLRQEPTQRAETLTKLLKQLEGNLSTQEQEEILTEALAAARELASAEYRAVVLPALAPKLVECYPTSKLAGEWQAILRSYSTNQRSDLLQDIKAIIPVILALGGKEAVEATFQAIQQVCRWWR